MSGETEIIVPAGPLQVRMTAPLGIRDDPGGRIFFWWGLTASALALAGELASRDDLAGRRVAELGCGLALPGICAGMSGARVTFTDAKQPALEYARLNAAANGLDGDSTAFEILDWEDPGDHHPYDLVVGAEIVYDYRMHDALLDVMSRLTSPGGTVLLADRKRTVVDRFMGRLLDAGFRIRRSESVVRPPGEPEQEISLYEALRVGTGP